MTISRTNQPFLITSRLFPPDLSLLQPVLNKSYIEIALAVNKRVIGSFEPVEVVTGETWFEESIMGDAIIRRQSFRQFFEFDAIAIGATLAITHEIEDIDEFTRIFGTCVTAVPDFRPIPYASATVVTEQIEVNLTSTTLTIINGATAPAITSGRVVVEYLKIMI